MNRITSAANAGLAFRRRAADGSGIGSDAAPGDRRPRAAVFVVLEGGLVDGDDFGGGSGPICPVRGAVEALGTLQSDGRALVVVANQSGLALGRFSRSQFSGREALLRQTMRSAGVELGPFVICPHLPGIDGRSNCLCRLPAPGLLVRAARAGRLDLSASWIVGNDAHDLEAGRRAGCRSAMLQITTPLRTEPKPWQLRAAPPDRHCAGWNEVVQAVLTERRRAPASP